MAMKMQPKELIDRIPEIMVIFFAIAGGVRWWLQWRAKLTAEKEQRGDERRKNAPGILSASLDSMQDFIDFYDAILRDCQGSLKDCLKEKKELRQRLRAHEEHRTEEVQ